jgi:hypothetical protein
MLKMLEARQSKKTYKEIATKLIYKSLDIEDFMTVLSKKLENPPSKKKMIAILKMLLTKELTKSIEIMLKVFLISKLTQSMRDKYKILIKP